MRAHCQPAARTALPPLDLSQRIKLAGAGGVNGTSGVELELAACAMQVVRRKKTAQPTVTIPTSQLAEIKRWGLGKQQAGVVLKFKFAQQTALGSSMLFHACLRDTMTLMRWYAQ